MRDSHDVVGTGEQRAGRVGQRVEVFGFHDCGQVVEGLNGRVVERVFLGGIEAPVQLDRDGGDVEENPAGEGQILARA